MKFEIKTYNNKTYYCINRSTIDINSNYVNFKNIKDKLVHNNNNCIIKYCYICKEDIKNYFYKGHDIADILSFYYFIDGKPKLEFFTRKAQYGVYVNGYSKLKSSKDLFINLKNDSFIPDHIAIIDKYKEDFFNSYPEYAL